MKNDEVNLKIKVKLGGTARLIKESSRGPKALKNECCDRELFLLCVLEGFGAGQQYLVCDISNERILSPMHVHARTYERLSISEDCERKE